MACNTPPTHISNLNNAEVNFRPDSLGESRPHTPSLNEPPAGTAISLDQPLDQITREVVNALPPEAIFFIGGNISRIVPDKHSDTGIRVDALTPSAFRTWVSPYATFLKQNKNQIKPASIDKGTAEGIMESPIFKDNIPYIDQVSARQLPFGTRDSNGKWSFTPMKLGYDERTRTYTVDAHPIDWEHPMPAKDAYAFINKQFEECRFDNRFTELEKSSGMSIIVATLLGQFLRHNISRFPICIVEANRPDAGKTFLVQTMLSPFYGIVANKSLRGSEEQQRRDILGHARAGDGFCFFDNVRVLRSDAIEQAVTSGSISYSKMYTQDNAVVKNRLQFFITANDLLTREDTDRRSRRIMLFKDTVGHDHIFKGTISLERIADTQWQRQMLTALWGLVQGWVQDGCPDMGGKHLSGFDDWRKLAGNITLWAGWADPCVSQEERGDTREQAFIEVLQHLASCKNSYMHDIPCTITIKEIIDAAIQINYIEDILNGRSLDKAEYYFRQYKNKCLNIHMQDAKGREFWLQEDRPCENGVRRPRELRIYFAKVEPEPNRPRPGIDLSRCTKITEDVYHVPEHGAVPPPQQND